MENNIETFEDDPISMIRICDEKINLIEPYLRSAR
jgi:hypothetical protein